MSRVKVGAGRSLLVMAVCPATGLFRVKAAIASVSLAGAAMFAVKNSVPGKLLALASSVAAAAWGSYRGRRSTTSGPSSAHPAPAWPYCKPTEPGLRKPRIGETVERHVGVPDDDGLLCDAGEGSLKMPHRALDE